MRCLLVTLLIAFLCTSSVLALDNGLARTPPMGWCSWERFRCNTDCANDPANCISANLMQQMADRIAEDGYADAGYEFVNIDDCYLSMSRDASGQLTGDPARFPEGMSGVADYIHSKGLKFGVYEDFGTQTCGGYPGSEYHIPTDANTFAAWGADMLKFDGCNSAISDMAAGYPNMSIALNATGRPFVYSCSWPDYVRVSGLQPNYTAVAYWCNLWRLFDDIDDSWDSVASIIDYWGDTQDTLIPAAGPGHWNDMDMIIIGNFGLSYEQSKAQMALWCLLASPLLLSADLRAIRPELREIILNKEVIGINQDSLGAQGRREWRKNSNMELWWRPLKGGDRAVVLFNRLNCCAQNITFTFQEIGVSGNALVRDLFEHEDLGEYSGDYTATVNGSGVVMLRVSPQPSARPASESEQRSVAHRLRHWSHLEGVF